MKNQMTYEEKYKMMVETPVNRLIPRLAVPTFISMLITSIYNMADGEGAEGDEPGSGLRIDGSLPDSGLLEYGHIPVGKE